MSHPIHLGASRSVEHEHHSRKVNLVAVAEPGSP